MLTDGRTPMGITCYGRFSNGRIKKKNLHQIVFHEELVLDKWIGWMDAQPETNMLRQLLQSWGH